MDTRDKRASSIGMLLPFLAVLPLADGAALSQGDRQHTAYTYRGIDAGAVAADAAKHPGACVFNRRGLATEVRRRGFAVELDRRN